MDHIRQLRTRVVCGKACGVIAKNEMPPAPGIGGMDLDLDSEVHSKFPDDMTVASERGVEMVGMQALEGNHHW